MAFNRQVAMDYLNNVLDPLDDYTKLPDDDSRIIKVRELFGVEEDFRGNNKPLYMIKATRGNKFETYRSLNSCAKAFGVSDGSIRNLLDRNANPVYNGWALERIYYTKDNPAPPRPYKVKKIYGIIMTKNDNSIKFNSYNECIDKVGISKSLLYRILKEGGEYKGATYEKFLL